MNATTPETAGGTEKVIAKIGVGLISGDPDHARAVFEPDAIQRLAGSMRDHGQLQPILVRPSETPGRFVIVAGERRWLAATLAGLPTVDAVVLEDSPRPGRTLELQAVENLHREDLSPLEQARAFRSLMKSNRWSARRLAAELHLGHATVVRALALLKLPGAVQAHVEAGRIAPSVAGQIGRLDGPDAQAALAERVVADGLTRDATARAVRPSPPPSPKPTPLPSPSRRVFQTPYGEVTIALDGPPVPAHFFEAVIHAARQLTAEQQATPPQTGPDQPGRPGTSHRSPAVPHADQPPRPPITSPPPSSQVITRRPPMVRRELPPPAPCPSDLRHSIHPDSGSP